MSDAQDRGPTAPVKDGEGESALDLRGLKCPLPVLRARKALSQACGGAEIAILADDPLAPIDIAHLCRTEGHALTISELAGGGWRFHILVAEGS
ncbi:sulfurtransferase TusA family protein [Aureimonas sp. ME7]|uniref:sulfurtransferase TusA family protein n=1 Tax=Aureimonas sp. ME7 TaxID=2744252 RepID=UPI0015F5A1EC|nr:sulfurtransferase TusA family protein [Aureimonas sp. ME7]